MFLWCILFCLRFWNQLYWLHLSVTLLNLICRGQDNHFLIHGVTYCCMRKAADVSEICTACLSALVQWCRLFMAVVTLFENFLLMNTYNGFLGITLSSLKPLTSNISSINWSVKKFKARYFPYFKCTLNGSKVCGIWGVLWCHWILRLGSFRPRWLTHKTNKKQKPLTKPVKHTEQFVWIRATQMASLPVDLTCTKTSASSLWSFLSVGNVSPTLLLLPPHTQT